MYMYVCVLLNYILLELSMSKEIYIIEKIANWCEMKQVHSYWHLVSRNKLIFVFFYIFFYQEVKEQTALEPLETDSKKELISTSLCQHWVM